MSNSSLEARMQDYQAATASIQRVTYQLASSGNNGQSTVLNTAAIALTSGSQRTSMAVELIERGTRHDGVIGSIIDTYA
jgi:hypothetical protein